MLPIKLAARDAQAFLHGTREALDVVVGPHRGALTRRKGNAFADGIEQHLPDERVVVLLSGGADSTVVALAAHQLGTKVEAISFPSPGPSLS